MARLVAWRRWLIAGLLAVVICLVFPGASGHGRFQNGTPFGIGIVSLEIAGSTDAAQKVMSNWEVARGVPVVAAVADSLGWDYLLLLAYGFGLAILAGAIARAAPAGWIRSVGAWAQAASLVAMVCDATENTGLLFGLDGSDAGYRVAQIAAYTKFALLFIALLYLVVAGIATPLARRRSRAEAPTLPGALSAWQGGDPKLTCDLVMKGGVTSGVVYPMAISALAAHYRFVNLGGSSAGAIAAATAAAAEYARASQQDGFAVVAKTPEYLGANDRLIKLFRPDPWTAPIFDVLTAFLGSDRGLLKGVRAFVEGVVGFPLWAAAAVAIPMGLAEWLYWDPSHTGLGPSVAITEVLVLILVPLSVVAGLAVSLLAGGFRKNGFGLSSGNVPGDADAPSLTPWLADSIDLIAGIPSEKRDTPLTLGDLWLAGSAVPAAQRGVQLRAAARDASLRRINLEVLTTSLTHGRPYRVPFTERKWFIRKAELDRLFPPRIAKWMREHQAAHTPRPGRPPVPEGVLALPEPWDLPVVFLARVSLSFPLLVCPVPLAAVDYRDTPEPGEAGEMIRDFEPVWMSDGGISSNFPIHFFDSWMPSRPTFGIDLASKDEPKKGQPPDTRPDVYLPRANRGGLAERFNRFDTTFGFVGALLDAVWAWMDNMQMRTPGYRDRVVRIFLSPNEGGLNLDMSGSLVDELAKKGAEAAGLILQRYGPDANGVPGPAWNEHRMVRLRSLLGLLQTNLTSLVPQLGKPDATQGPDLVAGLLAAPPVYPWVSPEQRQVAARTLDQLAELGAWLDEQEGRAALTERAPRPVPELRVTPKV